MPLKDRLKRAFQTRSPVEITQAPPAQVEETPRWPSNVYRPDEPLPRLKYRAPVKKEHKEKLEAFDFSNSWRRRSNASLHSPMGSHFPSRRGSRASRQSTILGPNRHSSEARRRSGTGLSDNTSRLAPAGIVKSDHRRNRHSVRLSMGPALAAVSAVASDKANGMFTSTVAKIVPARSAKLVSLVTTDKPRPASALVHSTTVMTARSRKNKRNSMLNLGTVEDEPVSACTARHEHESNDLLSPMSTVFSRSLRDMSLYSPTTSVSARSSIASSATFLSAQSPTGTACTPLDSASISPAPVKLIGPVAPTRKRSSAADKLPRPVRNMSLRDAVQEQKTFVQAVVIEINSAPSSDGSSARSSISDDDAKDVMMVEQDVKLDRAAGLKECRRFPREGRDIRSVSMVV